MDINSRPQYRRGNRAPSNARRSPFSTNLPIIIVILLAVCAGSGLTAFYLVTSRSVTVIVDGVRTNTRTFQPTVKGVLAELRASLNSKDTISPDPNTPLKSGMTITVDRAHVVMIDIKTEKGTESRQVYTQSTDPRVILQESGIAVKQDDHVEVDNEPIKAEAYTVVPAHIVIKHPRPVRLDDNGTITTINTISQTVGEAIQEAGLTLYVADEVQPSVAALIGTDNLITIRRSVGITITVDGRLLTTRTHGKTVGAAIAEIGVVPVGLDYVIPDEATPVTENMTIRIVRISEDDLIEHVAIPFNHTTKADPTLPLDTRQVLQPGINGVQEQRVRVRREDGLEISRSDAVTTVITPPRDEITAIGTLPVIKTMDTPTGQIQYWRVIHMRAASYKPSSAGKDPGDPTYGITATGAKLHKGIVAVDPKLIPLGTNLYVPGYGTALAADTGGAVVGRVIDLGYSDNDYQGWSQEVDVYLLAPAPAPDEIPLLPEDQTQP